MSTWDEMLLPEFQKENRRSAIEARKIGRMHQLYGRTDTARCVDCVSFFKGGGGSRSYSKCERFGYSHGPGTDWNGRYVACGKFAVRGVDGGAVELPEA